MILGHLALFVSNLSQARVWFEDVLGGKAIDIRENLVIVKVGVMLFALKPFEGEKNPCIFDHYGIGFATKEEVLFMYEKLQQRNQKILKKPYERKDGFAFYAEDDLGLCIEIFCLFAE